MNIGIRSDSDMYTFGYSFHPWLSKKVFADGELIMTYLNKTVDDFDLRKYIKYGHRIEKASWDSSISKWILSVNHTNGSKFTIKTRFLFLCTGYFNYNEGHVPSFVDQNKYKGKIIYPQHWPKDYDYSNKKVIIIGSGATAITLVPSMAPTASHVTMIQRSPTYIAAVPSTSAFIESLYKILPTHIAYTIARWLRILFQAFLYAICMLYPTYMKKFFIKEIKKQLPKGYNIHKHFTPTYDPWRQRFCVGPDGDIFTCIREGKASVYTELVDKFTAKGVLLKSGEEVEGDVIGKV